MENQVSAITPEFNFNYDQICEFSNVGCEESGFTLEGLKKHNEEFISKHLLLIKKKLEQNEAKNNQEISKLRSDQAEMAQILYKITQKLEGNDNKTNEILSKMDESLKKLVNIEANESIFLGHKLMRDEKANERYIYDNAQNKKLKVEEHKINNEENDNGKNNTEKNKPCENNTKIGIKKEKDNSEESEKNKNQENKEKEIANIEKEKEKEKEKILYNKMIEAAKEKQKENIPMTTERIISSKNQIELIEEDYDINRNNKMNKPSQEKNIYLPLVPTIDKDKEKEMKDLTEISIKKNPTTKPKMNYSNLNNINNVLNGLNSNSKEFKICRDNHILNNKKIRWEILLKKLTGYCALGISGKRPEDIGTVILDNENEKEEEKIEEEFISLPNCDSICSMVNMHYLLTNKQNTIIWKNGNNIKKSNSELPVLKEGDNLIFIYSPKHSQLKIQKGDYIFIFENVGNKARQILNPYIIFENKNDKAVFHNFQVLAEYKK